MNLDIHQKRFIKIVEELSYNRSHAFRDWCELSALALANSIPLFSSEWHEREKRYADLIKHYTPQEVVLLTEMLSCIIYSLTDGNKINFHDCLGEIHMTDEITGRSKWDNDVIFTPFHISKLMATLTFADAKIPDKGYITVCEPASGSGSTIIAGCSVLEGFGIHFQKQMHVTAVEIRPMIAHMAFIQLALLHVPAIVIHGDSLSQKAWTVWKTPAHVLGFWDARLRRDASTESATDMHTIQTAFDFAIPVARRV